MTARPRSARDKVAAMINGALERLAGFSASGANPLGRLLRAAVRRIPPTTRMPVLRGALRGKRWIVGAGNHAAWLGSYEFKKRAAFERAVARGGVVFDVGAHVGYYTLLAAVLVGPEGRVVAFEPAPRNLAYLRQHLAINRVRNATVIPKAVSDAAGTITFEEGDEGSLGYTGRISPRGTLTVETVSLDALVISGAVPPPDTIKIDVEGAEAAVLAGARVTLATHHPTVFLATHGGDVHARCCAALRAHGYALTPIDGDDLDSAREILARHEGG